MKRTSITVTVLAALLLTGCASTAEATGGKNLVQAVDSAAGVATNAVTKTMAKNLTANLESAADVAATLIENAATDGH